MDRVPQILAKKFRFETPLSRECLSTDAPDRLEPDGFYEPRASSCEMFERAKVHFN
jgi:hypothetical protein